MPELPEVEAVCRILRRKAVKRRIVECRIARPGITRPQDAAFVERHVTGRLVQAVERRGKNILLRLDGGAVLHVHLRMTGNLYVIPAAQWQPAAARASFQLEDGSALVFEDPRALGKVHVYPDGKAKSLDEVGLEPLSDAFTSEWLAAKMAKSRKPAKLFLMDQALIAGLGNIYAAEALFRAAIHPARPANRTGRSKVRALHAAIRAVLEEAVASAVLAYAKPGRYNEAESFDCAVYDREGEPCRRCGRRIRRIPQGGRSTYYCPGCQR